ncbi:hypothetical protein A2U01_0021377, partial [Trifolium medium]|nr:hypothetical protein [Trifolium medium]
VKGRRKGRGRCPRPKPLFNGKNKNEEELNREKRGEGPRRKFPAIWKIRKGKNGEKAPDIEFLQTHKFHEDNFLDTEHFTCSRKTIKWGEIPRRRVSTQTHDIYEDNILDTDLRDHREITRPIALSPLIRIQWFRSNVILRL